MDRAALLELWKREEQQPFSGWDFSYLDGRMLEGQAPWSYTTRAGELMGGISSVIDLDTGGAERFLSLRHRWPQRVVATEEYPPNVILANERLAAAGAGLVRARVGDDEPMPFADESFDLVLNRHAAFNAAEIARVLTPGGSFLTQQVHGMWLHDLQAIFDTSPEWPDATSQQYLPWLKAAGMTIIDLQEWEGTVEFTDVGAIVYYLTAIPWEVPGFSVGTHAPYLYRLQDRLDAGERLAFWAGKYLIEARKEGAPAP
jgi:SAM-dependent methyltransferase